MTITTPLAPPRMQTLADGVGYFSGGRMATRFGVRIVNLKRAWNSKYFFANVCLFMGNDHYEELTKYLGSIFNRLNAGRRTAPSGKDEVSNETFTSALFTSEVECGQAEMEIVDGGDAACANASTGLEPPPLNVGAVFIVSYVGRTGSAGKSVRRQPGAHCFVLL